MLALGRAPLPLAQAVQPSDATDVNPKDKKEAAEPLPVFLPTSPLFQPLLATRAGLIFRLHFSGV